MGKVYIKCTKVCLCKIVFWNLTTISTPRVHHIYSCKLSRYTATATLLHLTIYCAITYGAECPACNQGL